MGYKINRKIVIADQTCWMHANTEQEYAEKIAQLYSTKNPGKTSKTPFREFALNWFKIYSKPNVETATATTYKRQLDLYLLPAFSTMMVEDIGTDEVQELFNNMNGALSTKTKAKTVLNMIFEAAVEDGIIQKNPLQSKRIKITGKASEVTKEYTIAQMRYIISHVDKVRSRVDKTYLVLQALHPMRLEEVLGLKWEDIDVESMTIHICRAATHPTRNQPEIKDTKTKASNRIIGLSSIAAGYLVFGHPNDYVLGGEKPLSYSQVRRMCERIERDIEFDDRITPIRFRTTVLTDIYDQTKDVKAAQEAAGHTTSAMTLKYYVKGRTASSIVAHAIDAAYSG